MKRREALTALAGGAIVWGAAGSIHAADAAGDAGPIGGRLKQGVTRGVFPPSFSLEDCCRAAAALGARGFDFIDNPTDWPLLKRYGLTPSMFRLDYGGGLSTGGRSPPGPPGWGAVALPASRGQFLQAVHQGIDTAAAHGLPNLFVGAGSRDSVSSEEGAANAVQFFNAVKSHAEDKGVTLCMELLNSKGIDSGKNYLFDHIDWGVGVLSTVNSPRVRILYDIFHAQLMEGNIVQNLRDHIQWIGHIHLGGVPGRHQLDDSQELNYHFIAKSIADLGFTGFVTHEWHPAPGADALQVLRQSMQVMAV